MYLEWTAKIGKSHYSAAASVENIGSEGLTFVDLAGGSLIHLTPKAFT
jgi:hypothetical protein